MYRPMFVVQIMSSTLIICLTVFVATISVSRDMSIFIKYLTEMIAGFVQLLYWCWVGNKMFAQVCKWYFTTYKSLIMILFLSLSRICQSPNVAVAVYECDWYKMNTKYKMAILQIIRRSQKPIRFHAGALFQINFQTFITVGIFQSLLI